MYLLQDNYGYYFKCFGLWGMQVYTPKKEEARQFEDRKEAQSFAKTMLRGKHKAIAI